MSKPAYELIRQFKQQNDDLENQLESYSNHPPRERRLSLKTHPNLFHAENPKHVDDVIKLKYLADAGVPEAMILYAKYNFDGKYVPENKPKAFALLSKLLKKLPQELSKEEQLEFARDHLSDGFVGEVITYRYQHQYGTAFGHKVWSWGNQARLNFTRVTLIAREKALDLVRTHPAYASLAFGMFFLRIFYDLGVLAYSFNRDSQKRAVLRKAYMKNGYSRGRGNWEWFKRFMEKDGRPLRYANDLVWLALGITGFVLDRVGIGGYAAAVPLVLGFLFDVGVELYRAIKQYQSYTAEMIFLGEKIEECENKIESLGVDLSREKEEQKELRRQKRQGQNHNGNGKFQEGFDKCVNKINAIENDIAKYNAKLDMFTARAGSLAKERAQKARRSAYIVSATALLFVGMFIGRIIPLAVSIDPIIGLSLVFAASAAILLHKLIESIIEYKDQKLKEKILEAGETNNALMHEVNDEPSEHMLVDSKIIDSLKRDKLPFKEKYPFFSRKKAPEPEPEHDFDSVFNNDLAAPAY